MTRTADRLGVFGKTLGRETPSAKTIIKVVNILRNGKHRVI